MPIVSLPHSHSVSHSPKVVSPGIEPGYQVPETCILSIVLRDLIVKGFLYGAQKYTEFENYGCLFRFYFTPPPWLALLAE